VLCLPKDNFQNLELRKLLTLLILMIVWFFGYLSPMALRSEEHLIHTEGVAPAKAQLPEPRIDGAVEF
jgi:hypothetical protein